MTDRRYYQWIACLPMLLPLLSAALLARHDLLTTNPILATPLFLLMMSGIVAGPVYVIFMLIVFSYLRTCPDIDLNRYAWDVPHYFALCLYIVYVTVLLLMGLPFANVVILATAIGLFALLFGYAYVLIAITLRMLLISTINRRRSDDLNLITEE